MQLRPVSIRLHIKQKIRRLGERKKADGTYEYETPVKYWMPFNGGIGFHVHHGSLHSGGSRYQTNGSHGCVNMPPEMPENYSNLFPAGTPVVVHN